MLSRAKLHRTRPRRRRRVRVRRGGGRPSAPTQAEC